MKKLFKRIIVIYLFASCLVSFAYNLFPSQAWNIATNRNGLLCVGIDVHTKDYWIMNPFDNYGDSFLIGYVNNDDVTGFYSDVFPCLNNPFALN